MCSSDLREPEPKHFNFDHLKTEPMRSTSKLFHDVAAKLYELPATAQRAMSLEHLLIAKDAAVRAVLPLFVWLLAVLLFFAPRVAFAQVDPTAAPAVESGNTWTILGVVFVALVGVGVTVVTFAGARFGAFLKTQGEKSTVFSLLSNLWTVVQAAVAHAEAEIRPLIQSALADGKLDDAEKAAIKAKVIELVKGMLGEVGLGKIAVALGLTSAGVDTLISGQIERAVLNMKAGAAPSVITTAAAAATASPTGAVPLLKKPAAAPAAKGP